MRSILRNLVFAFGCIAIIALRTQDGFAIAWQTSASGAVMQQPSSQYYHYCYGGEFQIRSNDSARGLKISFLQRPEFNYGGFTDQESAIAVMYGGTLSSKSFLFNNAAAFVGASQIDGFIRENATNTTRKFSSSGLIYAFEWGKLRDRFTAALFHSSHIGFGSDYQSEAFVAWPYIFYGAKVGWAL